MQRLPSTSPYAASIGFSAAVRSGDLVHVAGTTALDASGEVVGQGPYAQAREVLRKVGLVLELAGSGLDRVVSTRVHLAHASDWQEVGRAHAEVFAAAPPAATMLVSGLLDARMLVEMEVVARAG